MSAETSQPSTSKPRSRSGASSLPAPQPASIAQAAAVDGLATRRVPNTGPSDLSAELERLDRAVVDRPGGELVASDGVDEVGAALPEADVLDVGARGPRRGRDVGVDDRELVALVLEEPEVGIDLQLEAVRRLGCVAARLVAVGDAVAQDEQAAALIRQLPSRVLGERLAHGRRHYHHSLLSSISSPCQKPAERYFQPPSARTHTTTPSSSSPTRRRATWSTAPLETPAKMPSRPRSACAPATASSFETRSFRSSFATS